MSRENLIKKLEVYKPMNSVETDDRDCMLAFLNAHEDCFERSQLSGHVTGSSWIVNTGWDKILLLHHIGLDKWLQPGGHCDGNPSPMETAFQEAEEETGLRPRLISEEIFDISAQNIPVKGDVPAHIHYDIRYLFEADENLPLVLEEGKASELRWVPLDDIEDLVGDDKIFKETLMRMIDKTFWLKQNTQIATSAA
jgi:8-oxo-dGTP pyrophosphatase MutT (NUDIX family)